MTNQPSDTGAGERTPEAISEAASEATSAKQIFSGVNRNLPEIVNRYFDLAEKREGLNDDEKAELATILGTLEGKYAAEALLKAITADNLDVVAPILDLPGEIKKHGRITQINRIEHRDSQGRTPALTAADYGALKVMRYLVEKKGADLTAVDKKGFSALEGATARLSSSPAMMAYLVDEAGMDPGDALRGLLQKSNTGFAPVERLVALVDMVEDVNEQDEQGWTLLHHVGFRNDPNRRMEVAERLIERGANPRIPATTGWTAIDVAKYRPLENMMKRVPVVAAVAADRPPEHDGGMG